jgi:hypothetical protein
VGQRRSPSQQRNSPQLFLIFGIFQRLFRELIKRHVNFILQRYKPLAISELEFAAMAGILLWNGGLLISANTKLKFAKKFK